MGNFCALICSLFLEGTAHQDLMGGVGGKCKAPCDGVRFVALCVSFRGWRFSFGCVGGRASNRGWCQPDHPHNAAGVSRLWPSPVRLCPVAFFGEVVCLPRMAFVLRVWLVCLCVCPISCFTRPCFATWALPCTAYVHCCARGGWRLLLYVPRLKVR